MSGAAGSPVAGASWRGPRPTGRKGESMFSNRVATSSASSDVSDGSDDVFDGSDPRQLAIDLLVTSARFTRLAARETPTGMPRALWRALALLDDLGPARVS